MGFKSTMGSSEFVNLTCCVFRGKISYFTHPPETHTLPTHVSAEIVTEMGKAFDWDELEKGNQEVLAGKSTRRLQKTQK